MSNAQYSGQTMSYGGGIQGQAAQGQDQMMGGQMGQRAQGGYPGAHQPGGFVGGGYVQPPYPMAAYAYGAYPQQPSTLSSLTSDRFLKGLLIGAAAAYILTNESLQRTAIKGAVKAWTTVQGGLEELKERFQDAEAELHAAEAARAAEGD